MPSSPKASFQRNSTFLGPSITRVGPGIVAPMGAIGWPSIHEAESLPAGDGAEHGAAAPDERGRAAPDVLRQGRRPFEVLGQADLGDDRGELGPVGRLDADGPRGIADLQFEGPGLDLCGHREFIRTAPQRRRDGPPRAEPDRPRLGLPFRAFGEAGRQGERLAVGDDQSRGQGGERGEGVPGRPAPRRDQPGPGVRGRGRHGDGQGHRRDRGHRRQDRPQAMPRRGDGVREVALPGVLGDLDDGRLAEAERTGLLRAVPDELDDPEETIADVRMSAGQEPGELVGPAVPPDPAIQGDRHGQEREARQGEQPQADPPGRVDRAIQAEQHEIGGQHAEGGDAKALGGLPRPDPGPERGELLAERVGDLQAAVDVSDAHHRLTSGSRLPTAGFRRHRILRRFVRPGLPEGIRAQGDIIQGRSSCVPPKIVP